MGRLKWKLTKRDKVFHRHPLCEYSRTNQFGVSAHRSHRLGSSSHGGWAACCRGRPLAAAPTTPMAWGAVLDGRSCGAVTLRRGRPRRAPNLSRLLEKRLGRPWAQAPAYLGSRAQGSDATRSVCAPCPLEVFCVVSKAPAVVALQKRIDGRSPCRGGRQVEGRVCLTGRRAVAPPVGRATMPSSTYRGDGDGWRWRGSPPRADVAYPGKESSGNHACER
jgi:hypothetical protein